METIFLHAYPTFNIPSYASSFFRRRSGAQQLSSENRLAGSFSNKNPKFGIIDDNCSGFDLDICPDLLLAGLALAAAGAFVALFTAITQAAAGGRRKKRNVGSGIEQPQLQWSQLFEDVYWHGSTIHNVMCTG